MHSEQRRNFILLAAITTALLPHLWAQPPWLGGLLLALLGLRGWQIHRDARSMPRWLLFTLAITLVALTFRAHHSLIGRDGGMAVLCCLIVVKLFEARSTRDGHLLLMLAYFSTMAFFLISQSPWMALLALSSCALVTASLLLQYRPLDQIKPTLKLSIRMLLEAIPLAVLLFVFFPRLPGPLWHMPTERTARSGLSAEAMEPGQVSQLALDDSIAFRAEFAEKPPQQQSLYWRGPVFDRFDGRRWLPAGRAGDDTVIQPKGPFIRYTMTLEPHQQRWLLALDMPTELPPDAYIGSRLQVLAAEPVTKRQRYTLQSSLGWITRGNSGLRTSSQLPEQGNPRARALGESWAALPPEQRIAAGIHYLRNNGFLYTLEPPLLNSGDVIDEFLFESKLGFCEHYAGAFTYLMRAAGVPARIVTGYQGGEFNSAGGYMIVRQADAHAWVEVWLADRGWQRIDPTAVIAPARIAFGLARSIPQGDALPMMLREGGNWLKSLRLNLDVITNGWNQWVIGYDAKRQMDFLQKLGIRDFLSTQYLGGLIGGIGLILGLLTLRTLWPTQRRSRDMASRYYQRYCRKLARLGLIRAPNEGALDFAQRAGIALPASRTHIDEITQLYLAVRYRGETEKLNALRTQIARFNP